MSRLQKLIFRYVQSLSTGLLLIGLLMLGISGYVDWHSELQNIGLALTGAGITTFIMRFEIREVFLDQTIGHAGIEGLTPGRSAMLDQLGGLESFFRSSSPKQIDIVGISMYGLFGPHEVWSKLISLAREGYAVRVVFADPDSSELSLQEQIELKPGVLRNHIRHLMETGRDLISAQSDSALISSRITVHKSRLLPKAFIIRSGNRMIMTPYLHRGPYANPCFLLKNQPDGVFSTYFDYIEDVILDCRTFHDSSREIENGGPEVPTKLQRTETPPRDPSIGETSVPSGAVAPAGPMVIESKTNPAN